MTDLLVRLIKEEEQQQVGRKLVSLVNTPSNVLCIKRQDTIVAGVVAEGGTFPADKSKDTEVSVSTKKIGVSVEIPTEWEEDNNYDFIIEKIREGVNATYKQEDKLILDELVSQAGNTITADESGELSIEDISSGMSYIEAMGYLADRLVVHPDQAEDMRNNGLMETLDRSRPEEYGMVVLVSDKLSSGTAIITNSKHATILGVRRPMTIKKRRDEGLDKMVFAISERVAPVVVRTGLVSKITGC